MGEQTPEGLYGRHKELALEYESAKNALPLPDLVKDTQQEIALLEDDIADIERLGRQVPQRLYNSLATLHSQLMQYRLSEQRSCISEAAWRLECNLLEASHQAFASHGAWRKQARQEMLDETGRDADDPLKFPGRKSWQA
jgi:hypothetical protein